MPSYASYPEIPTVLFWEGGREGGKAGTFSVGIGALIRKMSSCLPASHLSPLSPTVGEHGKKTAFCISEKRAVVGHSICHFLALGPPNTQYPKLKFPSFKPPYL